MSFALTPLVILTGALMLRCMHGVRNGKSSERVGHLLIGGVVMVLLVLLAYWPALRGQFVWDDWMLIEKNPLVTGRYNLASIWFQTDFSLSSVMLWFQWLAWGRSAAGYHWLNVLLHAVNCLLLWRLLAKLSIPAAWLCATLFALHPICVSSVAWISELKNTLSLCFFLVSFICYVKSETTTATVGSHSESDGERETADSRKWYWLSLMTFLLALLSKTSTVMLPAVLLGYVWWARGNIKRQDVWRTLPLFLLSFLFGLMSVWFQKHQAMAGAAGQTESLAARLALAGKAMWFYLGKAFLPLNLNLMYPRWELGTVTPLSYLPLILLCALAITCWRFRRTWGRNALFALGFFTVNLLPVLGFLDMYYLAISRVADHLLYISLIAVTVSAGAALNSFLKPLLLRGVAVILLGALTFLTFQRASVFATEESLWRDTLAKNPAAWSAHNNLGVILAEAGNIEDAMRQFEASLKFNPRNPKAHINLGRVLSLRNDFPGAESHFHAALEINPQDADARKVYAAALNDQGRTAEAIQQLLAALQSQPDIEARSQLAALYLRSGKTREAIDQTRQILIVKPDSTEALGNLAWLLATASDESLRNGAEAVRLARQACRLTDFKDARTLGTLAAAYAESGNFTDAIETAQQAVDRATTAGDPRFAEMNRRLLQLYLSGNAYHETTSP